MRSHDIRPTPQEDFENELEFRDFRKRGFSIPMIDRDEEVVLLAHARIDARVRLTDISWVLTETPFRGMKNVRRRTLSQRRIAG